MKYKIYLSSLFFFNVILLGCTLELKKNLPPREVAEEVSHEESTQQESTQKNTTHELTEVSDKNIEADPNNHDVFYVLPKSRYPIKNFNVNKFFLSKQPKEHFDCDEMAKGSPCREGMIFVCKESLRTAVCIDEDLHIDAKTKKPQGNMNLYDCQKVCASEKKRIPTNNEWLLSCAGSKPEECLVYKGNPISNYVRNHPENTICRNPNNPKELYLDGRCMEHPELISYIPGFGTNPGQIPPGKCESEAGVKRCVGTFEQWVSGHFVAGQEYRFNGGMYALPASAVEYVTPAHGSDFRHYAGGCRCATSPAVSANTH